MVSNPFQCLTLSLLILPPMLLMTYFSANFPNPPEPPPVHPSLASLPPTSQSWNIYPENFYGGGGYVTFPYGRVRYWLIGPEKGKKIVMVNGLSIPTIIWKEVAPTLASKGYRLLLYDLYGRGYSDAPQTTYDATFYATQLALLMQHVKWDRAHMIGLSMGGGIAASFTSMFPLLVDDKLALLACAGVLESSDISRTVKFMSSPLVQTFTSSVPFRLYMQHLANTSYPTSSPRDPIQELVRIQSAHLPGYNAAVASSLRAGPIRGLESRFRYLAASGREVLLIHGTHDTTVPYKSSIRIQSLIPNSRLLTLDSAGHDLSLSHSEQINEALLDFFQS